MAGPSGAVTDPFLGIGIQYQQRVADTTGVPDVDAAKLYAAAELQSRQYLDAEREKRKPNKMAILDMAAKLEGTPGEKLAWQKEIMGKLDSYERNFRQDPNYVFSPGGIGEYSSILESAVNPAKAEQMSQNYKALQGAFSQVQKNNTGDSFQVRDNQILAQDKDGNVSWVPLEQSEGYTPITANQRFSQLNAAERYDHATDALLPMAGGDAAKAMLFSAFETATGSEGNQQSFTSFVSNRTALNQAKAQAKSTMSSEVRAALQADYAKVHGGKYTEGGFQKYVDDALNQEIAKRLKTQQSTDLDAMIKAQKAANAAKETTSNPFQSPVIQHLDTEIEVWDRKWYSDDKAKVPISGISPIAIPTEEIAKPNATFRDGVWVVGGKSNASATRTKGKDGKEAFGRMTNEEIKGGEDTKFIQRATMPVTSGNVFDPQNKLAREVLPKELMIMKGGRKYEYGDGDGAYFPDENKVETIYIDQFDADGKPVMDKNGLPKVKEIRGIRRKDGYLVEVYETPVNVYETGEDDDRQTIFEPMTPAQSQMAFRKNISRYGQETNYFTPNGGIDLSVGSKVSTLMQGLRTTNPDQYNAILAAFRNGSTRDPEVRIRINKVLNAVATEVNDITNGGTFSVGKPLHTQKESGDYLRGADVSSH